MGKSLQQQSVDDELDLVEVVKTLWMHKWTVILTAIFFCIVAFVILLFIPPVYQLKAIIKPPFSNQVAALSFSELPGSNTPLQSVTANEAFELFSENMSSETTRNQFFNQFYWPEILATEKISKSAAYKQFNDSFKVHKNPKKMAFDVTIRSHNPEKLLPWFTQFVETVENISKQEIEQDIKAQLNLKIAGLRTRIDTQRFLAKKAREDRLIQLEEAVKVASEMEQRQINWIVLDQSISSVDSLSVMYLLGVKALKLEIDNLKNRQSDDPFTSDLRALSSTLSFYEHLKPEFEAVSLYRLDGVIAPEVPVYPKRMLLGFLALLLGVLVGSIVVFFRLLRNKK